MTIDLTKLSPAPWTPAVETDRGYCSHVYVRFYFPTFKEAPFTDFADGQKEVEKRAATDADFIALARNAFDGDPEAIAWWEANRKRREPT